MGHPDHRPVAAHLSQLLVKPELHLVHLGVGAVLSEERLVVADLGHAAELQADDLVGVLDGLEPVRDYEGRAPLHQPVHRAVDEVLAFRVHG